MGFGGPSLTSPPPQLIPSALPMAQVRTTLLASTVSLSRQQWGTHIALKFVCTAASGCPPRHGGAGRGGSRRQPIPAGDLGGHPGSYSNAYCQHFDAG